jgi:ATP-dependent helicase/nuclease subunit B
MITEKNTIQIATTDEPFLKSLAKYLLATYQNNLFALHIVLPTRRACVYLRYYLSEYSTQTFIAPVIRSIDDFVMEMSALEIADHLYLLFELYDTYKQFDKNEDHNLEKFTPLGTVMLRDFDMIDRNMADGKAIFEYLSDVKRIEVWAEKLGEEDAAIRKSLDHYVEFWKYLKDTYIAFRKKLIHNQKAYTGLAYSWLATHITALLDEKRITKVIFAGFNQLTTAEEVFIRTLLNKEAGEIYWDMDKQYVADSLHEASRYFRQYLSHEHSKITEDIYKDLVIEGIANNPKNIDIISVNSKVLQAKVTGHLLEKIIETVGKEDKKNIFEQSINHTAIVLPEESMLIPMLYSLPIGSKAEFESGIRVKDSMNITMGLTMDKTPLFNLLQNLFRLQKNIKLDQDDKISVYYKDLMRILRHPFIFYSKYQTQIKDFLHQIQKENRVFVSFETLSQAPSPTPPLPKGEGVFTPPVWGGGAIPPSGDRELTPIFSIIFRNWEGKVPNAIEQFFDLVQLLEEILDKDKNILEAEYLLHLYKVLKRMQTVLGNNADKMTPETFKQLFFEILKNAAVPFHGEPLAPMHMMGMLETHALDFENIIILSCNEGILPKGKLVNSIIPFDIRAMFKLPTHKETDALHAYTFYRLFHRAKNITLIYTEGGGDDGMQAKEKSRFITQLQTEWKDLKNITITERQLTLALPETIETTRRIKKTSAVVERLKQYLTATLSPLPPKGGIAPQPPKEEFDTMGIVPPLGDRGLGGGLGGITPSYINMYLKNPLDFYKKKVLNLKDPDEMEEWLEANTFGNLIHGYLEEIIVKNNLLNRQISEKELQKMLKQDAEIEEILIRLMGKTAGKVVSNRGKNMILKRIAQLLLKKFIDLQITATNPVSQIIGVEKELQAIIPVLLPNNTTLNVVLKGNADRIDIQANKVRVVDYKTGYFDGHTPKAQTKAEILQQSQQDNASKDKIVQLMLYRYLLLKESAAGNLTLPPPYDKVALTYQDVEAGFYFFQKLKSDFVGYELADEATKLSADELTALKKSSKTKKKDDTETTTPILDKHEQTKLFFEYVESFIATIVYDMLDENKDFMQESAFAEGEENSGEEE